MKEKHKNTSFIFILPYIALSSSLIFVFSSTFWKIAGYIKIYSLFVLSTALCFYIVFIWEREKHKKYLYLLAFIYGLAISNHNLSSTIFPSLLYLVFTTDKDVFKTKILTCLFLLFFLGFSIYLYLPIRALAKPEVDWGFPITFKAFIDYITIAMAREKMFNIHFLQRPWFIEKIIDERPWIQSPKIREILKTMDKIWRAGREITGMYEQTMEAIISSCADKFPIYYTFFRRDERMDTHTWIG